MQSQNRRWFFTFAWQCIVAVFVAPSVLPKVAEAMDDRCSKWCLGGHVTPPPNRVPVKGEPIIRLSGVDLSGYIRPVNLDMVPHCNSADLDGFPIGKELGLEKWECDGYWIGSDGGVKG